MHSIKNLQQEPKEEVKRIRIETYEIRDRSIRFKDEVRRAGYMVMDRKYLGYLNIIEKANGLFCAYFNGLIAYVGDIGVRTEQYWCPIKHAARMKGLHSRYAHFAEFGDSDQFRANFKKIRVDFADVREDVREDDGTKWD